MDAQASGDFKSTLVEKLESLRIKVPRFNTAFFPKLAATNKVSNDNGKTELFSLSATRREDYWDGEVPGWTKVRSWTPFEASYFTEADNIIR